MPHHIDLDEAATQIEIRRAGWTTRGLTVGQVTWRDQGAGWPPALRTDRTQVLTPDSTGVEVRKGRQEGSLVLFDGGWADLLWWSGESQDDVLDETPGWDDWLEVGAFGDLLDRFASLFQ